MFFSFYSIFCLGSTKNEGHICNLHAKTQLLMYDKGGLLTKKFSTPEGRWRTVRKPGLDENSGFEWKNLYFLYQWPKRNSFQGYSFSNSILMQIWDTLGYDLFILKIEKRVNENRYMGWHLTWRPKSELHRRPDTCDPSYLCHLLLFSGSGVTRARASSDQDK